MFIRLFATWLTCVALLIAIQNSDPPPNPEVRASLEAVKVDKRCPGAHELRSPWLPGDPTLSDQTPDYVMATGACDEALAAAR